MLDKHEQSWWRQQTEIFSALLAICAGNSPVPGEFPAQRPVTRSFGVFFDLRLNKRLSKQSWGWWFEKLSRPLWRHCIVQRRACIQFIQWYNVTLTTSHAYTGLRTTRTTRSNPLGGGRFFHPVQSMMTQFTIKLKWNAIEKTISLCTYSWNLSTVFEILICLLMSQRKLTITKTFISAATSTDSIAVGTNFLQATKSAGLTSIRHRLMRRYQIDVYSMSFTGSLHNQHFCTNECKCFWSCNELKIQCNSYVSIFLLVSIKNKGHR